MNVMVRLEQEDQQVFLDQQDLLALSVKLVLLESPEQMAPLVQLVPEDLLDELVLMVALDLLGPPDLQLDYLDPPDDLVLTERLVLKDKLELPGSSEPLELKDSPDHKVNKEPRDPLASQASKELSDSPDLLELLDPQDSQEQLDLKDPEDQLVVLDLMGFKDHKEPQDLKE